MRKFIHASHSPSNNKWDRWNRTLILVFALTVIVLIDSFWIFQAFYKKVTFIRCTCKILSRTHFYLLCFVVEGDIPPNLHLHRRTLDTPHLFWKHSTLADTHKDSDIVVQGSGRSMMRTKIIFWALLLLIRYFYLFFCKLFLTFYFFKNSPVNWNQ